MAESPHLFIVGGPNGSGKTTLALEYADELVLPYVGADAIAATLNPTDPAAAEIAAARQFIRTIQADISQKTSLVCESTLSGLTMRNLVASARDAGYSVSIAFLFVESADVCVARVAQRVRAGGHDVPESDIRRRFTRSIRNFWAIYRELADRWVLLYNGKTTLEDIAVGAGDQTAVRNSDLFATFLAIVGDLR
ncbi:MAG: AAA family ATPase [Planctomycetales bacterium]|nr:AAA family ATPase [Planctomycetales bacterium]